GVQSRLRPECRAQRGRRTHGDVQLLRIWRKQRCARRALGRTMKRALGAAGAALVLLGTAPGEHAQTHEDRWTFALTPYVWLPNINGTLKYSVPPGAAGSPDVSTGPNNYLQNLQHVLMLAGEARMEKWSIHADAIYLDFADQASSVK